MATNSLWAQLNAGDMIASCGPEIAEVLNQVDLLVAKKRDEWDEQLREAVKRAEQEQKHIHQVFLAFFLFLIYSILDFKIIKN